MYQNKKHIIQVNGYDCLGGYRPGQGPLTILLKQLIPLLSFTFELIRKHYVSYTRGQGAKSLARAKVAITEQISFMVPNTKHINNKVYDISFYKNCTFLNTPLFTGNVKKNLSRDIFSLLEKAYTQVKRSFQNFVFLFSSLLKLTQPFPMVNHTTRSCMNEL